MQKIVFSILVLFTLVSCSHTGTCHKGEGHHMKSGQCHMDTKNHHDNHKQCDLKGDKKCCDRKVKKHACAEKDCKGKDCKVTTACKDKQCQVKDCDGKQCAKAKESAKRKPTAQDKKEEAVKKS